MLLFLFAVYMVNNAYCFPISENDIQMRTLVDLSYLGERVFGTPSNKTGENLEAWNKELGQNPEELGEYAEGDILFPRDSRNGLIAETFRWKDGVVPYEMSPYIPITDRNTILRAMDIYHKYTCITFRKRNYQDKDYISIINGNTGCWSSVGRIGGKQNVNLQTPSCTTKVGTPIHELMHAIGFLHEQNRYERDDYVEIVWKNIGQGHEGNFQKADKDKTNGFGVDYDYNSVMHYSKTAFSINQEATIIAKDKSKAEKIGQRDGFSLGDIKKINNMYGCPNKLPTNTNNNNLFSNNNSNNNNNNNNSNNGFGGLLSFLFSLT